MTGDHSKAGDSRTSDTVSIETFRAAVNRIDVLEQALRLIRDHQIPQGMSPALFAEKVLQ